jgi:transcriptional regulator with XRE-family HTH domain
MTLGKWLQAHRDRRGWTRVELAYRIAEARGKRITEGAIFRWERDKVMPHLDNFRVLCELFDVPADEGLKLLKSVAA